ncbi:MAG: ribose 5-phosphate isomerase B [Acidobacteriales bacterium]|nr:ribose 5-phosphate isomerase B [Terriglobales bacterium]
MKIAIGADHAGFLLKESLKQELVKQGHVVDDRGTNSQDSCDYPDFASAVAHEVASGGADYGVLVCMTGTGMVIAANKVDGARAVWGANPDEVRLSRAHNNANVLALGSKYTSVEAATAMLDTFLRTSFEGGRHERRVNKIGAIENENRAKENQEPNS